MEKLAVTAKTGTSLIKRTWRGTGTSASDYSNHWCLHASNMVRSRDTPLEVELLSRIVTECRRTSPNFAVNCHSPMELRSPTARKSHPNFVAHCKRSTEVKKYSKTIIPNVQNTMRTQVTPMVSNYGKGLTNWYFSISKHHVNAWFMHIWVKHFFCYKTHLFPMFKV